MTNIILVGNPNTGKTTLFNTLTNSNNHVGNWHGVTVDVCSKKFSFNNKKYILFDLPGIYSLNTFTPEEKVATNFLQAHSQEIVVNIVDANNLSKNLFLTLQLIEKGYFVVLAVNMANEVKQIDYAKLSKALGIAVVPIDARKKKSVSTLMQYIQKNTENKPRLKPSYVSHFTDNQQNNNQIRFNFIDKVLSDCCKQITTIYGHNKLDKILLNKYFALPIFLLTMLLVFVITFGAIGNNFSVIISSVFQFFSDILNDLLFKLNLSAWAHALIMQGVIGGIGVVVGFLPQVALLFLCINFLEDIGYLSRVAIMFDGTLKKLGLTGKSLFSILLGFGCTTSAMLTTKALDNIRLRKRTALVLPFASCSAKLPVYALVCSAFFTKHKILMVFCMYVLGLLVGLIVSVIASKISKNKVENFIMEVPPLRIPTIAKTFKNLGYNVASFIKRVGGTIVVCSLIVWVLSNISFGFKYVTNVEHSMLYCVSRFIYPIFKPLGFSSPLVVVALLVGIIAKEMIVSSLAISNGVLNLSALATSLTLTSSVVYFTVPSALAFLVFILLYSPCISALSVTAKEVGRKFAVFVFIFQFGLAYVCALVVNMLANLFIAGKSLEAIIVLIVLALVIFAVIKYRHKKNMCLTCKGIMCGKTCMQKTK